MILSFIDFTLLISLISLMIGLIVVDKLERLK